MNEENESVRLDEILKFSTTVSKGVLLKFLNSIFNENFELDQVQITVSNNEFINVSFITTSVISFEKRVS